MWARMYRSLTVAAMMVLSGQAFSAVVYQNGVPDNPPVEGGGAVVNNARSVADDFTLSREVVLTDMHLFTFEQNNPDPWDGTLVYRFFDSDANAPETPGANLLGSGELGANDVTRNLIGDTPGGGGLWSSYEYSFDLLDPIALTPGSYWVNLYLQEDDATGNNIMMWQGTFPTQALGQRAWIPSGAEHLDPANWIPFTTLNADLAFYLTGVFVPAPAPLMLLLGGVLMMGVGRKKS